MCFMLEKMCQIFDFQNVNAHQKYGIITAKQIILFFQHIASDNE